MRNSMTSDPENLHYLVAQMIDHLNGNPPVLRLLKGT
jgi:hypothetical protein